MEKERNKDWMDAVREQCLSDGAAPAPGGWEAVGAKMRRAAARRRTMLAAAVALPAGALILWAPWRETVPPSSPVAQVSAPAPSAVVSVPSVLIPDSPAVTPAVPAVISALPAVVPDRVSVIPELIGNPASPDGASGLVPEERAPAHQEEPVSPPPSEQAPNENEKETVEVVGRRQDPLLALDTTTSRHRPKLSIGLRGSAGTIRRESEITLHSAAYVATLMYLNNDADARNSLTGWPSVKTNSANSAWYNGRTFGYFAQTATARYRHDLPVSVGLSARLDVTPRIGIESGVEYTYLHSMATWENTREDQRLHFIGIPLRADVRFWSGRNFDLYAGAGGKVEKCVSASMGLVACEEPRLQWSAEAFGGVQYQPWPGLHLYFQPALSWYFTKTDLPTYRTENPLGFSLHAGLRFDL